MIDAFRTNGSSPPDFDPADSAHHPPTSPPRQHHVRNQERSGRDWPTYVVIRHGRFLQERTLVEGFHWATSGVAWCRDPRYATKYPRTIARLIALARGGEAVEWSRRHG